jgi:hypothetical protein
MSALLAAGYADLRAYVIANWGRVRLYNAADALQLSLAATDPRVVWGANANPFTLTVNLSGADADTLGKTFYSARIFKASDAAYATSFGYELFAEGAATVGQATDTLTLTATFELPDL